MSLCFLSLQMYQRGVSDVYQNKNTMNVYIEGYYISSCIVLIFGWKLNIRPDGLI